MANFETGTYIFGDERGNHASGETFYYCQILKKTKCFIYIKGLGKYDCQDKIRCKVLKDKNGFYVKPHRVFNSMFESFKLYSHKMLEEKEEEEEEEKEEDPEEENKKLKQMIKKLSNAVGVTRCQQLFNYDDCVKYC